MSFGMIPLSPDDKPDGFVLLSMYEKLESENAKLRELVRDMMRFFEDGDWCTTCEQVCKCEAQEQYEEDCLMRDVFRDRMCKLGVEVGQ